ncbi:hypothetical protein PC116_g12616 [Phytophthora cactorum]|nr:hypothetical protein PC116_g12616 [Phytophthora cactorum]
MEETLDSGGSGASFRMPALTISVRKGEDYLPPASFSRAGSAAAVQLHALEDSWHCLVHLQRVLLSSETTGRHTRTTRRWHLVWCHPTWIAWSSRYMYLQSTDELASIVFGAESRKTNPMAPSPIDALPALNRWNSPVITKLQAQVVATAMQLRVDAVAKGSSFNW